MLDTITITSKPRDRSSYLAVLRRIDYAHPSPLDLALWTVATARAEGRMLGDSDGECLDLAESMIVAAIDYCDHVRRLGRPALSVYDEFVLRAALVRAQRWICAYAARVA